MPSTKASRLDTDYDALLEAQGFVARPGPRPHIDEDMAETLAVPEKTVKSRLYTARQQLRTLLVHEGAI